ncbi:MULTISPECIES: HAD family hydrolase [unclassified Methanoregula]|uniref:HAD family hydrolase n=1 Tax=unclassified Methanoregula TaxID=2649730 RepID=UPI0009CD553E|nr:MULTISPECIES: HAD family hydrolase [unclassified Methanoregula]OPX63152.1 MAG: Soluble P-type ATPase-like phosphatase [Methanoregula sp. PtaB.Bin085]OPY33451.1 MAG: Soluble P-type ATPase-like phosphatase [Methanoregula sp. PtaU1.Bin006]
MSVAVVFDSAGTLLNTYRVAKDICNNTLLPGIETTTLTFSSPDRVLIVLPVRSKDLMAAPAGTVLSEYLVRHDIGFGISCTRKITTADEIGEVLYADDRARVGDLQECIRNVWTVCKEESVVTLNSGAIINMAQRGIEFAITAGGWPFDGAKDAITALHRMGVPTFIASGDRVTKLEKMADHLGIPRDRVYGVATPTVKAQIVSDLRQEYDKVLMVGDGINDLCAMRNADIAILTVQQPGDRPEDLYKEADHVVSSVGEVVTIVEDLLRAKKSCDRDGCDTTHKR